MAKGRGRLPFVINDLYGGLAKVAGLMILEQNELWLEFEVKDNVLGGLVRSGPKEVGIPLDEIESVRYKRNWFESKFFIRTYRMGFLENVPGAEKGEVKLKIKRKDGEIAKRLESKINLIISELNLDQSDRASGLY